MYIHPPTLCKHNKPQPYDDSYSVSTSASRPHRSKTTNTKFMTQLNVQQF